jgi:predicted metal-dependent phosphoesterase TrpH
VPTPPTPEAIERHPHLAQDCPEGFVRVDLHSHTMWSGDSTTTPDELAECVAASGIDVLCVTDHNAIRGAHELEDVLSCRVVVGEELKTHAGELIGLFLTERIPQGIPPVEAAQAIRDQGGIVYIPHPFDPLRNNLREDVLDELVSLGLVDGIEVINGKTSLQSLNRRAADYAAAHGLAPGAGSDAHVAEAIGAVYHEMPDFHDATSFLDAMRAGRAVGHHYDPPRRWRPRIVPSTAG